MELYSADLAKRPQIVVINKTDIPEVRARLPELVSALNQLGVEPLDISAATGDGIQVVLDRLLQGVEPAKEKRRPAKEKFVDGAPLRRRTGIVTILEDGTFEVRWSKAQRLVVLVDTDDQRIVGQLFREFKRLGVIGALEAKGVKYGDPVRIGDWEFDWGDMIAPDMEW